MSIIELESDAVTENPLSDYDLQLQAAYELTPDQFTGLKVAERDLAIFLLLREIGGSLRSIEMRLNEYEGKAQELASPEGLQKVMDKFMGGGKGMGGLGGMMGLFR